MQSKEWKNGFFMGLCLSVCLSSILIGIGWTFGHVQAESSIIPQAVASPPVADVYAYESPRRFCQAMGGSLVGHGPLAAGLSHRVFCRVELDLFDYQQGSRQDQAVRQRGGGFRVESFVNKGTLGVEFREHVKTHCGEDVFVGAANPRQNSGELRHMANPFGGSVVTEGEPVCYDETARVLYMIYRGEPRTIAENLTLGTIY